MYIVLFGAPGVGKGTQAQLLAERKNFAHLSTGDEFRRNMREETELGKLVKPIVQSGNLVSDEIVSRIVTDALSQERFSNGCIFDGYPRTTNQAQYLDSFLQSRNTPITKVINIEVDEDNIVSRLLQRGRVDDTEQVIRERLAIYQNETAPLLEYYQNQNILVSVNGVGQLEEVYNRIVSVL